MKILVLTRSALNSDDNMGNTIENLLGHSSEVELHSIFMRSSAYTNNICKTVYQISEQELIKSILNGHSCGCEVVKAVLSHDFTTKTTEVNEKKCYDLAKRYDFYFLWFLRELIWSFGHWKTQNLIDYLNKIQVDIIFMPSFNCWYPYMILNFVKSITKAKVVLYHADDNFTIEQSFFSPVKFLYRILLRKRIKTAAGSADLNFCISKMQVEEYENKLGVKCELLQKFAEFNNKYLIKAKLHSPLKLVYTGNISSGRWATLALLGKVLDLINIDDIKAQLYIYSGNTLDSQMQEALSTPKSIFFRGYIPGRDIPVVQEDADILVHVESFLPKYIRDVRLSFSTKIVDYLTKGKCILAIGPDNIASIRYFMDSNAGYTITDKGKIYQKLKRLICDRKLITDMAKCAWEYGKKHHDKDVKQKQFIEKLQKLCKSV